MGELVPSVERPSAPRRGWLRRLVHTPASDLLRLRLTGRCDLAHRLDEAALPAELRAIVVEVVRRTGLGPVERAEAAGKLIAHFREGLASGKSAERLAADFGRPRRAARIMRVARRQARPLAGRISLRAAQTASVLAALLVGLYVFATVRLLAARPGASRDYLAMANAPASVLPAGERAWPLYREAIIQLGEPPAAVSRPAVNPGDPKWDEAARWLWEKRDALGRARQAASMPDAGYMVGDEVDPFDRALWPPARNAARAVGLQGAVTVSLMPYLREMRRLAALLCLDALRAAEVADARIATEDLLAALGIAGHAREQPFAFNDIVGADTVSLAATTLGGILSDQPDLFTDAQLGALAHKFWAVPLRPRLEGERYLFEDFVQRAYSDDGAGDGRLTARGLELLGADAGALAPVSTLLAAGRRATVEEFERWLQRIEAEGARPLWQRDPAGVEHALDRCRASWSYCQRYMPVVLFMPSPAVALAEPELAGQERDAVCTAIALVIERRRRGAWAQRIEDLPPHVLPSPPADRFDGATLRYVLRGGRPLLYSVGPDCDDDGGRAALDAAGRPRVAHSDAHPPPDGDWLLWPASRPSGAVTEQDERAAKALPRAGG